MINKAKTAKPRKPKEEKKKNETGNIRRFQ